MTSEQRNTKSGRKCVSIGEAMAFGRGTLPLS